MPVRRRRRSRAQDDPHAELRAEFARLQAPVVLSKRQNDLGRRRRIEKLEHLLTCKDRPKSKLELSAIRRQLEDLRTGHKRGLVWDEGEAQRAVASFRLLRHPKGRHAGNEFALEDWQEEVIVAPLFGWYWGKPRAEGGRRRFRRAYIEMPRKNGKTALAAGLIHKLALFDDEPGVEVYTLAGSADQAGTLFDTFVKGMMSAAHLDAYKVNETEIEILAGGVIKLLSSKHGTAHSYDPHAFVLDELHVQPDRRLWDAMISGQAARANPMAIAITTAGHDRSSLCWEMHEDVRQVLDPDHPAEDDALFGFIAAIDPGDDWQEPDAWRKANPNFGITVTEAYYVDQVAAAKRSPGLANSFRQLNLDEWTSGKVQWINLDEWDACGDEDLDDDYLQSLPCWGGFDIGDKRDLSAFTLVFRDGDRFIWRTICWAPLESISDRADRDRSFVKRWIELGHVRPMPGQGTDEGQIARDIVALIHRYDLRQFAYDPSGTVALVFEKMSELGIDVTGEDGIATEFSQSYPNFTPVMREFQSMLIDGRFAHDGSPLLRWQASNLVVKKNHKDQIMCDKSASAEKIDGMVAGFMGSALALEAEVAPPKRSDYYETHEVEAY